MSQVVSTISPTSDDFVRKVDEFFKKYIFGFIYHDIQTAIEGDANYLAALGLVVYTEFMGGLVNGTLGKKDESSKKRFYAFWSWMGSEYETVSAKRELVKVYSNVRSGLVHSYFISQDSVVKMKIGDGHGQKCGIEVMEPDGMVMLIVEKYFADFKTASTNYFTELVKDREPGLLENFLLAVGQQWYFSGKTE